jgi:hypothetical protein
MLLALAIVKNVIRSSASAPPIFNDLLYGFVPDYVVSCNVNLGLARKSTQFYFFGAPLEISHYILAFLLVPFLSTEPPYKVFIIICIMRVILQASSSNLNLLFFHCNLVHHDVEGDIFTGSRYHWHMRLVEQTD